MKKTNSTQNEHKIDKPNNSENNHGKKATTVQNTTQNKNTLWINSICLFVGVIVFVLSLVAPKTIMAMMDQGELNELYVRDVETDLALESEAISVEDKLE